LLTITACGQTDDSAGGSAFTPRDSEWQAAMNAEDVDAIAALYRDDARLLPPNAEATIGKDGVRAAFGGMIEAGLSIKLNSIESMSGGDIAYVVGSYALMAGDDVADEGKYIETWRRGADGQWLMANDIWNSDMPVAAPEMPKTHLMITHEVEDADHWLAAWRGEDSRHTLFTNNGAAHVHTFQSANNPNLTGLVVAVSDMDALRVMLGSEEGLAAAAEDGVKADTLTVLTEAK
jgi:ketosteroid isomerase-like protein